MKGAARKEGCRFTLLRGVGAWRAGSVLKLDIAVFADRGLLDRVHFAFEARQFSGFLIVATDEESRRPKDNDSSGGGDLIVCALLVLCARGLRRVLRNALTSTLFRVIVGLNFSASRSMAA